MTNDVMVIVMVNKRLMIEEDRNGNEIENEE